MGIIKAFTDSISGTFADQWKEIITVQAFDEHTAVSRVFFKSVIMVEELIVRGL